MPTQMKPKFKVGQVVRINVPSYKNSEHEYRKIKKVYAWPSKSGKFTGFGYVFVDDDCHEKYLRALSARERGE